MVKNSILIIDDHAGIRSMVASALETIGYQVVQAVNGQDALDKLTQLSFDCIITDLKMPQVDGLEFLDHLTSRHNRLPCPVIVFSSVGQEYLKEAVLKKGASAFIPKDDISPNQIIQAVQAVLAAPVPPTN